MSSNMNAEENAILSRLLDIDKMAIKRNCILYSDFLNVAEYSLFITNKELFKCDIKVYDFYDMPERQMIAFLPDASFIADFPIDIIKCTPKSRKFSSEITHRDVLGSLMGLQIERKLIGDIFIVDNKDAYIFTESKISQFLIDSLNQIGRNSYQLSIENGIDINIFKRDFLEKSGSIASKRLDVIVAECTNKSRANSSDCIKKGDVYVNSLICDNISYICKENDIISIRHQGKYKILEFLDFTRSGRIKFSYLVYK